MRLQTIKRDIIYLKFCKYQWSLVGRISTMQPGSSVQPNSFLNNQRDFYVFFWGTRSSWDTEYGPGFNSVKNARSGSAWNECVPRTLVSSSNATAKCKKCMDVLVCVDSGYGMKWNGLEWNDPWGIRQWGPCSSSPGPPCSRWDRPSARAQDLQQFTHYSMLQTVFRFRIREPVPKLIFFTS
jgi:hypothetical protein